LRSGRSRFSPRAVAFRGGSGVCDRSGTTQPRILTEIAQRLEETAREAGYTQEDFTALRKQLFD
jgi:hypothetical protein